MSIRRRVYADSDPVFADFLSRHSSDRWMMTTFGARSFGKVPWAELIEQYTGYRAIHFPYGGPPQWLVERTFADMNKIAGQCNPIWQSGAHEWFYLRDLIAAQRAECWPNRPQCVACAKRLPWHWSSPFVHKYSHLLDRVAPTLRIPCTRNCSLFEASSQFAGFHSKEMRKYWEHISVLVCSPECHDAVARRYQRITLDAKELRLWVSQGRELLNETQTLLGRRPPRAFRSLSAESNRQAISET